MKLKTLPIGLLVTQICGLMRFLRVLIRFRLSVFLGDCKVWTYNMVSLLEGFLFLGVLISNYSLGVYLQFLGLESSCALFIHVAGFTIFGLSLRLFLLDSSRLFSAFYLIQAVRKSHLTHGLLIASVFNRINLGSMFYVLIAPAMVPRSQSGRFFIALFLVIIVSHFVIFLLKFYFLPKVLFVILISLFALSIDFGSALGSLAGNCVNLDFLVFNAVLLFLAPALYLVSYLIVRKNLVIGNG